MEPLGEYSRKIQIFSLYLILLNVLSLFLLSFCLWMCVCGGGEESDSILRDPQCTQNIVFTILPPWHIYLLHAKWGYIIAFIHFWLMPSIGKSHWLTRHKFFSISKLVIQPFRSCIWVREICKHTHQCLCLFLSSKNGVKTWLPFWMYSFTCSRPLDI